MDRLLYRYMSGIQTCKHGFVVLIMACVQPQIWSLQSQDELHLVQLLQLHGAQLTHHGRYQAAQLAEERGVKVTPHCQAPGSVCKTLH